MSCVLCDCCCRSPDTVVNLPKPAVKDYNYSSIYYGVRIFALIDGILMFSFFVAFSLQQIDNFTHLNLTHKFEEKVGLDPTEPLLYDGLLCFMFGFAVYAFLVVIILKAKRKRQHFHGFARDFGRLLRESPGYSLVFVISLLYFLLTTSIAVMQLVYLEMPSKKETAHGASSTTITTTATAHDSETQSIIGSPKAVESFCIAVPLTCIIYYMAESFCVLSFEESIIDRKKFNILHTQPERGTRKDTSTRHGQLVSEDERPLLDSTSQNGDQNTSQNGDQSTSQYEDQTTSQYGDQIPSQAGDQITSQNLEDQNSLRNGDQNISQNGDPPLQRRIFPLEPIIACLPARSLIFLELCCLANCISGIINFAATFPIHHNLIGNLALYIALIPVVAVGKLKCRNISVFYSCRLVRWR